MADGLLNLDEHKKGVNDMINTMHERRTLWGDLAKAPESLAPTCRVGYGFSPSMCAGL